MSLRLKLVLYLLGIHLVFAGVSGYLLIDEKPWLLALELFFLLSFLAGARLVHHLRVPLDLIGTGAELIGERDFTSKFIEVGQPEMDRLVGVYNRMIDQLREERTRLEEQHYFMDKILAASPSGIVTLDFDGRIALANPAAERLLGLAGARLPAAGSASWARPSAAPWRISTSASPRCCPCRGGGCAAASRSSSTRASPAASSSWRS